MLLLTLQKIFHYLRARFERRKEKNIKHAFFSFCTPAWEKRWSGLEILRSGDMDITFFLILQKACDGK